MRAILSGLVACCVASASGEAAARGGEWVVLRVERVEVAVARADGSPWDDGPVEVEHCRIGGADSFRGKPWHREAQRLCIEPAGSDASAPDLFVKLVAGTTGWYATPVARNAAVHRSWEAA